LSIRVVAILGVVLQPLIEGKTELKYIQEILRHRSSKTTEIYTHVSKTSIANIKNPLDSILKEEGE